MARAASEPAWLVRLLAGLIHEQPVLTLARELDEILSVLSFEGLALICMGENESPARAVDVGRGVGLREVACEVFRGLQGGDCSLGDGLCRALVATHRAHPSRCRHQPLENPWAG